MPTDLDFNLYFNIAFFSILGLGLLFGFLKGLKKAMWGFFATLIFMVVFFLTIDQVVNVLWTVNMPFLGGLLSNVSSSLANVSTLQDALPILLDTYLGDMLTTSLTNEHFLELITSLSLFVLKIVYTLVYFTVIQILYRLILWILRMIIFPSKKKTDKYRSKNRGLGALFGVLSGAISLYVTIIIFGGLVSISQSVLSVMPEPEPQTLSHIEFRDEFARPTQTLIPFGAITNPFDMPEFEDAYNLLNDMVTAYNDNIIVTAQNQITMTSEYTGEEMPMNLYLFDSVLSMTYQEEQIAIREELAVFSNVASQILNTDMFESDNININALTGDDVRNVFNAIADSNLITSILPIGIELAADFLSTEQGTEIEIPVDDLYDIAWDEELSQLGEVAGVALDIINAAGILNEDVDLTTVQLDGDDVQDLFEELGQSQLVTLAAYVAIEPILEMAGDQVSAIITVPDDIVWEDEFAAIGALAGAVLNTSLTVGDIESGDVMAIISVLADIDFTILLDSRIITNAMINILSGAVPSLNLGAYITIPDDIIWLDELNTNGEIIANGELRNILLALNNLLETMPDFDLENLNPSMIAELDADAINSLFESRILVATITQYIKELPLGDFMIIMPDTVFDEDGYLLKTELQKIVTGITMVLGALPCDDGDDVCAELGFDFNKALTLSADNIDIMLDSEILAATVGNVVIDMAGDILTIPGSALTEITVDGLAMDVVSPDEIKNAFLAISTLGITGIEDIDFDLTILNNLGTEADPTILDPAKADQLFSSVILNATLSSYLISFAEEADAFIIVPYEDQDGNTIRIIDAVDGTEYISEAELTNILEAVLALDLQDITSVETLDISLILDNVSVLLESAILHATVSQQLLNLTDVVTIPLNDQLGDPLRITTGPSGSETTFIARAELESAIDALSVLGITDIENVTVDVSILNNLGTEADPTILDQDKADQLFASSIINATLSSYIIDFTDTENPVIVVPYNDQDGIAVRTTDPADGTEYISQVELTNILKGILILDLQDFNSIDTLSLDTIINSISTLLDSAILHATVSKQLLDLTDVVTIPLNDQLGDPLRITTGPVGHETEYIAKAELQAAIDALSVLGITDINNVAIDVSILNNLGTDADPTILDTTKSDQLFASSIINATLSSYIIDFTEADDPFIIVPYNDQDGVAVRTADPADGTEYISQAELTNILEAILILDLQDFNTVETLSLDTLIDNVNVLLDSAILHATISKQLLDLTDVVTVPMNDQGGDPLRITTGPAEHETEFIAKAELQAAFDALSVLGITDINNVSIDVSILNNLGTEGDATVLDQAKADQLFSSSIINATLSAYIIDFTEGDDPFIIVPFEDQDAVTVRTIDPADGTEYISQAELTNIMEAILALNLQDFNTVETLSLDTLIANVDVLLASAVMHATISKQLVDLGSDIITIPTNDQFGDPLRITTGPVDHETLYVERDELKATFDSLEVLGITDINNVAVDISILTNVATDADPTVLDQDKADILFASTIINATISSYILDFAEGESPILVVPYKNESDIDVRIIDAVDATEFITQEELTNILKSILALDLSDFNAVDTLSLQVIIDNKTIILDSAIMQATISKQLFDLGSDIVNIPYKQEDNFSLVRITTGDVVEQETEIIARLELEALFDSLSVLGITDINSFGGDISFGDVISDPAKIDILLSSSIIQATITEQIVNLVGTGDEALLIVPYRAEDNSTDVRLVVGDPGFETEYITVVELKAVFDALNVMGMGDVNDFGGSFDLNLLKDHPENISVLVSSTIIQATISKQVFDMEGDAGSDTLVIIPYKTDIGDIDIRKLVGPVGFETELIIQTELIDLIEAFIALDFQDVNDVSGTISLSALADNATTVFESYIIQAIVSKQVIDLSDANTITVPFIDVDNITRVRNETGPVGDEVEFITKVELEEFVIALQLFGDVTDVNGFDGAIDLTIFYTEENRNVLLSSAIFQATISKQVIELEPTIVVPLLNDLEDTDIRFSRGVGLEANEYLAAEEIHDLFEALEILGFDEIDDMSGTLSLSNIFPSQNLQYDMDQNILLASSIIQATFSKQIDDLSGSLRIPFEDQDNTSIQITTLSGDFYIYTFEIKHLINALDLLNVGDITSFTGNITFDILFETTAPTAYNTNQNTLLASAIIHATITDKINALDAGAIQIPVKDIADDDVKFYTTVSSDYFIVKDEIKALLNAMDILGFNGSDISSFSGGITLSNISDETDQDTVLSSAIMHATISNKLIGLDDDVLFIPIYTEAGESFANRVQLTVSATDYVYATEIKAIINALIDMDITNLESDLGTPINTAKFFENSAMYLESSSIQATLSNKLLAIDALVFPDEDIRPVTNLLLKIALTDVTYIESSELLKLMAAMDLMNLTNFDSVTIDTGAVFGKDYTTITESAIMQATISDTILVNATDENSAASGTLIVPSLLRETIEEDTVEMDWIERTELIKLLSALEAVGLDFSGEVAGNAFGTMSEAEIDTMLLSGSMHVTVDFMLQSNSNINTSIPNLAIEGTKYGVDDVIYASEIKAFIIAVQFLGGDISGSISFAAISTLSQSDRDTSLNSMIIRCYITPTLETANGLNPLYPDFVPSDYETGSLPQFLTYSAAKDALDTMYPTT